MTAPPASSRSTACTWATSGAVKRASPPYELGIRNYQPSHACLPAPYELGIRNYEPSQACLPAPYELRIADWRRRLCSGRQLLRLVPATPACWCSHLRAAPRDNTSPDTGPCPPVPLSARPSTRTVLAPRLSLEDAAQTRNAIPRCRVESQDRVFGSVFVYRVACIADCTYNL